MSRSEGSGWRLLERDGLKLIRCGAIKEVPGVTHAFSTRCGDGGLAFDLSAIGGDEPRRRFLAAAGLGGREMVELRQVHGSRVIRSRDRSIGTDRAQAKAAGPARAAPPADEADATVALRRDATSRVLGVRTADCVPILIADRQGAAVAAVHAGWRGTAAAIARKGVEFLADLGIPPGSLLAAVGPAIGPCCYEVSSGVLERVARACSSTPRAVSRPGPGKDRLDLSLANEIQLLGAGIPRAAIHRAPWCTSCSPELLFSYRRDGAVAGRQMACIGWR